MNPTTHSTGQTGFEPDQVPVPAQNATPNADDSIDTHRQHQAGHATAVSS